MAIVDFDRALEILRSEGVLGIPTETVYGLAARINSEKALRKIFETKQRPFFDPLIVHLSSSMNPKDFTLEWPSLYEELTTKFWPGPLTLIAPKNNKVSDLITAGLPDVALRCPRHRLAQKLIKALDAPVAAPSANMFGKTSPTSALHVESEFGGQVAVLDGGDCEVGLESTVVSFDASKKMLSILRPGFISRDDLNKVCREFSVTVSSGKSRAAPGQLKNHYQPKAPLVLQFTQESELSTILKSDYESQLRFSNFEWKTLKLPSAAALAARTLYSSLRELSQSANAAIWVPINPELKKDPQWEMILDRLNRAASLVVN